MPLTIGDMRLHVLQLADAFHVLVQDHLTRPEDACTGPMGFTCAACGINNVVKRIGMLRCGRCKHPAGLTTVTRFIRIAPITGHTGYAIALHEMGHGLAPNGNLSSELSPTTRDMRGYETLRDVRLKLEEEEAAWEWAHHYALDWTVEMEQVMVIGLGCYARIAAHYGVKYTPLRFL